MELFIKSHNIRDTNLVVLHSKSIIGSEMWIVSNNRMNDKYELERMQKEVEMAYNEVL
jgi:hypothetical protein